MATAFEPIDFIVPGVPKSPRKSGAHRLAPWRERVQAAARAEIGPAWAPVAAPVKVQVVYYHRGERTLDVDNMVKPINDALKDGVLFTDDNVITDVYGARRRLDEEFILEDAPWVLVTAIRKRQDFVHVVVSPSPDARELLT